MAGSSGAGGALAYEVAAVSRARNWSWGVVGDGDGVGVRKRREAADLAATVRASATLVVC
jgi:hypothetical protein